MEQWSVPKKAERGRRKTTRQTPWSRLPEMVTHEMYCLWCECKIVILGAVMCTSDFLEIKL